MATITQTNSSDPVGFLGTEGHYMLPHHASEIERLTKQHEFISTTTKNQLLAPAVLAGTGPLKILDAGCADGHWLRDLRSQFPNRELELVGVDLGHTLFPSAEEQKASGITLYDHNITKPFPDAWKNSFDIIHQRLLVWGLQTAAWPIAVKNYVDILKPGGVLHLVEAEFVSKTPVPDNLPQLQKQAALQVWATESFGMDIDIAYKMEALLSEAGLKDVQKVTFDYGFGALAVDPAQKNVSAEAFVECFRTVDTKIPDEGIPGVAKEADEFHDFLDKLEVEIKQYGYEPKLNFVYGTKA